VRGDTFVRAFDRNPQDEFVLTDSDLAEIIGSVLGGLL
jgi:hypothetical protein